MKLSRNHIQKKFRDRGISQAVFAEAAGITESHLAHVLAGRRTSQYVTDLLSNFFGESIEIIPVRQAKNRKENRRALKLRQELFQSKPIPKAKAVAKADAIV